MPPRYAYWTILVDDQPTAFRASAQEDLMPTLKRLQAKHASAKMMWFQNGKLWNSRVDAQEAMHARGEMGRRGDARQAGGGFRDRDRKPFGDRGRKPFGERRDSGPRTAWTPRGEPSSPPPRRNADEKLEWKPKGEFVPAPKRAERPEWKPKGSFDRGEKKEWRPKASFDRDERPRSFKRPDYKPSGDSSAGRPEWKPKGAFDRKTEWKPKGSFDRDSRPAGKPEWKPKGSFDRKTEWKPKGSFDRGDKPAWKPRGKAVGENFSSPSGERRKAGESLEWKPKGESSGAPTEKRRWVPKEEYKKSMGIEAKRDSKWRPGGLHRDPKQKYKDAKKAKWTKFKKAIRTRAEAKGKKKSDE